MSESTALAVFAQHPVDFPEAKICHPRTLIRNITTRTVDRRRKADTKPIEETNSPSSCLPSPYRATVLLSYLRLHAQPTASIGCSDDCSSRSSAVRAVNCHCHDALIHAKPPSTVVRNGEFKNTDLLNRKHAPFTTRVRELFISHMQGPGHSLF